VLAADGLEEPAAEQVGAQLGERPTAVRQADRGGRLLGEAADRIDLSRADPGSGPDAAGRLQGREALAPEGVQVGVGGVRMHPEQPGDGLAVQPGSAEQKGFGAAALPGLQRAFEQLVELAEFSGARPARR
jgi:hypothetical protein